MRQQLHIPEPDPNRQSFRERVRAELVGELARERTRLLPLLVVPEIPSAAASASLTSTQAP